MNLEAEIFAKLKKLGADFVLFTDIGLLPPMQSRDYPFAIVLGIALSPGYIFKLSHSDQLQTDEFDEIERKTDQLADHIAAYLSAKGFDAFSQSETNLISSGLYQENTQSTVLPHKTIAGLAGLGWIGKHNLLVNPEYGSAISFCTVLTDAPLDTLTHSPASPECGDCVICRDICTPGAIKGNSWRVDVSRETLVDINRCTACLKCLVHCPWTQDFLNQNLEN